MSLIFNCRCCRGLLLIFICNFILQTGAKVISKQLTDIDVSSNLLNDKRHPMLEERLHQRTKRASNAEISHLSSNLLTKANEDTFTQTVAIVLGIAVVFCLSSVALVMCIFCNACEDDKSSEVGGANGYVGEINLADIQVIYNPAAGAPQLPYTHHNAAFKSSQEDIVVANPAVLQVTSLEGVTVRKSNANQNQNHRLAPREETVANPARRLGNAPVEQRNKVQLEYENMYADKRPVSSYPTKPKDNNARAVENGKENKAPSGGVEKNFIPQTNRSLEYTNTNRTNKDYDMNDFTLKNMHARH